MLKNIVLSPSSCGQLKKGVKNFPGFISSFIKPMYIIDKPLIKYCSDNIYLKNLDLYNVISLYKTSINIGGDHSIAIPSGAASLNKYKDVKFIWIDAHADINTYESSSTKNYHGMPLAFLTGMDTNALFPYIQYHLPFKNLYYVGIRDLDQFETETIEKHNIKYTLSKDVNKNPKAVYDQLSLFINKSPVHISFDVDAIDPKYISTTGTPVPNGLEIEAAKELLDLIMKNEFVVALDIVEMNIEVDPDNKDKSLMNFKYLFSDIFD